MNVKEWFNPRLFVDDTAIRLVEGPGEAPRLFVIDNFLDPDIVSRLLPLFDDDETWDDNYGLFNSKIGNNRFTHEVSRQEWIEATPAQRFWFFRTLRKDPEHRSLSVARAHFLMLTKRVLVDPLIVGWLQACTGTELGSPVVQSAAIICRSGHFQAPHTDDDEEQNRRLCGALYFSDGWQPGFGGEFDMMIGDHVVHTVVPKANRIVLFSPHQLCNGRQAKHRVRPLLQPAGDWKRLSISIWWNAPDRERKFASAQP